MADPSPPIRTAQATSILLLSTASGLNGALSLFVIPRLLESPTPLMLRQWRNMYAVSSRALPPLFLGPALLNLWLALRIPGKLRAYVIAAAVPLSILPWTWIVMMPVNRMLLAKAERWAAVEGVAVPEGLEKEDDEMVEGKDFESPKWLVDQWGVRNLYRTASAFLAACVGLYAALS